MPCQRRLLFLRLLLLVGSGLLAVPLAAQEAPFLPLRPERLIKLLPPPPEGWKVTRSDGSIRHFSWPVTTCRRDFTETVAEGTGAVGRKVSVTIKDTGRHPSLLGAFAGFKPGEGPGIRRYLINEHRAIAIDNGSQQVLQILVGGRILIDLRYEGLEKKELDRWILALRLGALTRLPKSRTTSLPPVLEVTHIDELNEAKNRSYTIEIASEEEVEAAIENLPQVEGSCPEE